MRSRNWSSAFTDFKGGNGVLLLFATSFKLDARSVYSPGTQPASGQAPTPILGAGDRVKRQDCLPI